MGYPGHDYLKSSLMAAAGVSALMLATGVHAQTRQFDIPAQSAETGIPMFGRQADLQILAAQDAVSGKRVNEVKGVYTADEGLSRLLRGANLVVVSNNGRTAVIAETVQYAQNTLPADGASRSPVVSTDGGANVEDVVVVGTRASLQSAISRKRASATTVDSIVSEDVSQFPDKNIAEALQRVTGVQLGRSGEGEGTEVYIRGVSPDLNRVEVNGLTAINNNPYQTPSGQRNTGRSASLLEMAPELIASVDVFKGFTADMTEGGIGGTVSIHTRKPLDLRKPLLSVTASAQYLDIAESTKFRGNITAGDRFFDNRLGVILNITHDDKDTRGDYVRDTEWGFLPTTFNTAAPSATQPFAIGQQTASGDLDNSPDKTYVNPTYADVMSKADCPQVPNVAPTTAQVTAATTCLQQWSEYKPGNTRYGLWARNDKRDSGQMTVEYRVNDNLRVFADYQANSRKLKYQDYNFSAPVNFTFNRLNATTYDRNGLPLVNAGYAAAFAAPAPTIDDEHNLVDFYMAPFSATGGSTGTAADLTLQQRSYDYNFKSQYISGGFNWSSDHFKIDGIFGSSRAHNEEYNNVLGLNGSIPNIHVSLSPDTGAPTFEFPTGFDINDPATLTQPARDAAGTPFSVAAVTYSYRPTEVESAEDSAKIDLDWFVDSGFIDKVETGVSWRSSDTLAFGGGGYVTGDLVNAPVTVLGANVNYNITFNPAAGASSIPPAFTPGTLPTYAATYNAVDFASFVNAVTGPLPKPFFNNASYNPGVALLSGWATPLYDNTASVYNPAAGPLAVDFSLFNHNNVRQAPGYVNRAGCDPNGAILPAAQAASGTTPASCLLPNGEIYDQLPATNTHEDIQAAYAQVDFGGELNGMKLTGNAGVRFVRTAVTATGSVLLRETVPGVVTPTTPNPANITRDVSRDIRSLDRDYTEVLPTFNVSLDITDKLVGRFGYAKVMARPRATDLGPAINCLFDRTPAGIQDDNDDTCTAGNPGLKPYLADQFDLNLGYYYNRDTLVSAGLFFKDVNSFIVQNIRQENVDIFGDGRLFTVTAPGNIEGVKISGAEFSAQTAFTFLPAPFDGLGAGVNYTYTKAENSGLFNSLTGEPLPLVGISRDSYNLTVFYDKGPYNLRIAYAGRSKYLQSATERSGNPRFQDGTGYLDAKFTYRLGDHIQLFAEGTNLLGEVERSTSGSLRLIELSWAGRRYLVGATYRY